MYEEVITIVSIALADWGAYDSWCLLHGFDPLEIPSRRMVNSIWAWLTEGMEPERVQALIQAIQPDTPYVSVKKRRTKAETEPPEKYKPDDTGKGKFRAPEGWKPPGYNEEKAYKASKAFLKAQRTGFKTGGE